VVEDQEDNRQILRDLLKSADYEMTEAETGEEAITAVARQRPGLIPDGHSASRHGRLTRQHAAIKADPALSSIPIIAVTSYALSGDEDKCREAGCDGMSASHTARAKLLAKFGSSCHSPSFTTPLPLWVKTGPMRIVRVESDLPPEADILGRLVPQSAAEADTARGRRHARFNASVRVEDVVLRLTATWHACPQSEGLGSAVNCLMQLRS